MGLQFALAAFLLGAVGWWVDSKLGCAPWGAATGGTAGLAGGLYLFFKEALQANREANEAAGELRRQHKQQADDLSKNKPSL